MVLCGQDYSGVSGEGSSANIYGINPVPARDLAACVNACTSQGTACAGVSWQGSSRRCDLKRTMFPTDASLAVSGYDSVVRISAGTDSAPPPAVTQLSNGDFNTGALPPWNNTFALDASVNVVNNAAYVVSLYIAFNLLILPIASSPLSATRVSRMWNRGSGLQLSQYLACNTT